MDLLKLLCLTDCRIYFGLPAPPHFLSDLNRRESVNLLPCPPPTWRSLLSLWLRTVGPL